MVESLPSGPGMAVRRIAAGVLVLVGLLGPFAAFGWSTTPGLDALAVLRGLSPYVLLVLGFVLVYHRRPTVWPVALGWCGLLLGFELLSAGAIQMAVGFGEGWRGLVAAPVAVVVAYGCGRLAQLVLNRPLGRDLAGARTEVVVRLTDGRLLVQWDRLVHGSTGKLGNARANGPGLLYSELAYAQLGQVGGQPVLRVAGEGRQWLLHLEHANPQQVLDLVVARAEKARKDPKLASQNNADRAVAVQRHGEAVADVRAGATAMAGGSPGFKAPVFVLVVAIACLTIAVMSFFPALPDLVLTGPASHTNVAGGIVFGLVGLIAARTYRRFRRGLRYLRNHSGEGLGQHLEPQVAPVPGWSALGPAVMMPVSPAKTPAAEH
ncbi:hypothetical protein ABZU76_43245 [Amycolatopsis sp. NPDC005232]|uniref:hypothetical protein n=1 Tax=Amycolatopsis sp. NPDC005232 TaxID=3157027 RepID=UPI0033B681B6